MISLHELVLDYFIAGVEACDEDDLERGGAILQIALTLAENAQTNSSGDHDLDVLIDSVVYLITTSRDIGVTDQQAAAEFVDGYLPGVINRIGEYWASQE